MSHKRPAQLSYGLITQPLTAPENGGMSLFQLFGYIILLFYAKLFSVAPAPDLTTSPLQDLALPLPAAPGHDIPRCQDFVPGGNIPGDHDAALKAVLR